MKFLVIIALALTGLAVSGAHAAESAALGTRVISETETTVGLFIAPWREEAPSTTDRPPRLFDVPFAPVDEGEFRSAVEMQQALRAARRTRLH